MLAFIDFLVQKLYILCQPKIIAIDELNKDKTVPYFLEEHVEFY